MRCLGPHAQDIAPASAPSLQCDTFGSMPAPRFAPAPEVPGLAARRIAADILDGVLQKRRMLDDQLEGPAAVSQVEVKIQMGSRRNISHNINNQRWYYLCADTDYCI
mgnify:CR=1 FL=1